MNITRAFVLGAHAVRTLGFAGQQLSLPFFERLLTGGARDVPEDSARIRRLAFRELTNLLKRDATLFSDGILPLEALRPEAPAAHWWRFARILADGVQISRRRSEKRAHELEEVPPELLADVPDYYRRNFHFQTGGYLTPDSAELYEHQVEILFAGGGDAMRRLLLRPLKERFPGQGEGLHFLEVGAGTGRLTRFVKLAFPKARITVVDLSWAYLKAAQKRLREFDRIEFVHGAAEDLPFVAGKFDLVYSCFLFHELPLEVRRRVFAESARVLRADGVVGVVDSLQSGDAVEFDDVLARFPRDFHEPFYRNYLAHPLAELLTEAGFTVENRDQGFLSKALLAVRHGEPVVSKK